MKKMTRREFLRYSGLTGLLILSGKGVSLVGLADTLEAGETQVNPSNAKVRYGMFIDLEKCIGCNACTMACIKENQLPEGITPNRVLKMKIGEGDNVREYYQPILCMHCENPVCANVCPVKATYKREDGIVVQDNTKCIGCKYCMQACPYRVRMFNKKPPFSYKKKHPGGVHVGGTVIKCTFCKHRIDAGNISTACCDWCPTGARVFGDLNDPESKLSKLIRQRNGVQLQKEKLTEPQVYYGLIGR